MKSIKNIILLLLCTFIVSCNDDDAVSAELKVLASNVTFSAAGGVGSVQLSHGNEINAVSDREWCLVSVEQNVIKVEVSPNDELEGRTAGVTITAADEKIIVPVSQEGCMLSYKRNELRHIIPYEGGSVTVHLRSNKPYEVVVSEDAQNWLSYKVDLTNGTLTFIALPSVDQKPRAAVVKVKAAGKEILYSVGSYTEKDLNGMWEAVFENNEGVQGPILWGFESKGSGSYVNKVTPPYSNISAYNDILVPMEFNNGHLHIVTGEKVGEAVDMESNQKLTIWTVVQKNSGGITWDSKIQYVAYPSIQNGKFALVFSSNADFGYDYVDGFGYWTFNTATPSTQSSTGYLELFRKLVLYKK